MSMDSDRFLFLSIKLVGFATFFQRIVLTIGTKTGLFGKHCASGLRLARQCAMAATVATATASALARCWRLITSSSLVWRPPRSTTERGPSLQRGGGLRTRLLAPAAAAAALPLLPAAPACVGAGGGG
jgi:hypothetical protein